MPKRNKNIRPHKNLDTNFYSHIIHNSQEVETTQMFSNRLMGKQNEVHPYNRMLIGHRKNEVLIQTTIWMNFGNITQSEGSPLQKTTYYMIPFIRNTQNRQIYRDKVE